MEAFVNRQRARGAENGKFRGWRKCTRSWQSAPDMFVGMANAGNPPLTHTPKGTRQVDNGEIAAHYLVTASPLKQSIELTI